MRYQAKRLQGKWKGIWPSLLVVIHCIVDEQFETNCLAKILITIGFNQMVNQL